MPSDPASTSNTSNQHYVSSPLSLPRLPFSIFWASSSRGNVVQVQECRLIPGCAESWPCSLHRSPRHNFHYSHLLNSFLSLELCYIYIFAAYISSLDVSGYWLVCSLPSTDPLGKLTFLFYLFSFAEFSTGAAAHPSKFAIFQLYLDDRELLHVLFYFLMN